MHRGDAELARARFFCDPQRCFAGEPPCFGFGKQLTRGCRVEFPRAVGAKGVIVGSRTIVLFINPSVNKYSRIDSSTLALATSLRYIREGEPCMPIMYSRPLASEETRYTLLVDEAFKDLAKDGGDPYSRSQNIWVLLYAPKPALPSYIVMGRFKYVSYVGGALCVAPQEHLVADLGVLQRVRARHTHVTLLPPLVPLPVADDLEERADIIETQSESRKRPRSA